ELTREDGGGGRRHGQPGGERPAVHGDGDVVAGDAAGAAAARPGDGEGGDAADGGQRRDGAGDGDDIPQRPDLAPVDLVVGGEEQSVVDGGQEHGVGNDRARRERDGKCPGGGAVTAPQVGPRTVNRLEIEGALDRG